MCTLTSVLFVGSIMFNAYNVLSDCNFGFWGYLAAEDECQYGESGDSSGSYKFKCTNDNNNGTMYYYDNTIDCSGDATSSENLEYFVCGNSGSCNTISADVSQYIGNTDCSGDKRNGYGSHYSLPKLTDYCYALNNTRSVKYTTNNDGLFAYLYASNNDCSGTPTDEDNITGYCNSYDGNSSKLEFSNSIKYGGYNNNIIVLFLLFVVIYY